MHGSRMRIGRTLLAVVALAVLPAVAQGADRRHGLGRFTYLYGLASASYSLTEGLNGTLPNQPDEGVTTRYRSEGTVTARTGARRHVGQLVNIGPSHGGGVYAAFRFVQRWHGTVTRQEQGAPPRVIPCEGTYTYRAALPFAFLLSLDRRTNRIRVEHPGRLVLAGLPGLSRGCAVYGLNESFAIPAKSLPLALFMRRRFPLEFSGSNEVGSRIRHAVRWTIRLEVVRERVIRLPG